MAEIRAVAQLPNGRWEATAITATVREYLGDFPSRRAAMNAILAWRRSHRPFEDMDRK